MIFLTVLNQVIILFILIFLGVLLTKKGIFTESGIKSMTELVLRFVTPCVIIKSFIREFDPDTLKGVLISFVSAAAIHILFILVGICVFRERDEARRRVLRFGIVFSNCGYMSLPLQEAVLGADGVVYGASFIAIFNIFVWSYGIFEMSGDRALVSPKKLFINPGMIGVTLGIIVFLIPFQIPAIIEKPISYLAALNTPLPMMIIGYHLANSNLKKAFKDLVCWGALLIRLVALPMLALASLYLCGIRGNMLISMVIAACAPSAAITTMFSSKFGKDTELSVNLVSLSTVISLITIPPIVTLAQIIS